MAGIGGKKGLDESHVVGSVVLVFELGELVELLEGKEVGFAREGGREDVCSEEGQGRGGFGKGVGERGVGF